ncbi:MAG: outer membrane protein transport protein [Bacteroidetes bacterium]|nr:outer membrane protein transport protein [Bacteroidota bacterium]
MKRILCLYGIVAISISFVHAQLAEDALRFSQYRPAIGAQSLGFGGTSVGIANDFTALFTNPAGLAQLRVYEFSFGLSHNGFSNNVTFWNTKETIENNKFNLDNIGIVYPLPTKRGSLTFGFGVGRLQQYNAAATFGGFNIQNSYVEVITPKDDLWAMSPTERKRFLENDLSYYLAVSDTANGFLWPILTDSLNQRATILEDGGLNHWSIGMGIDIAPNISFGVSLNIASGHYGYDRTYVEEDKYNVYRYGFPWNIDRFLFTQTIDDNVSGFNALIGLLYRSKDKLRFGISLRTPTWYSISERYGTKYQSEFDDGYQLWQTNTNETEYRITTPMVISGGFSLFPVQWLLVAADVEYVDWTQLELEADDPTLNSHLKLQTQKAKFDLFRETINLRGGAEFTLLDGEMKIRGGIAWYPSPYKEDQHTTKYDKVYYSAGTSIRMSGDVYLHIGYTLGDWKSYRRTSDLFSVLGARQTYESILSHVVSVTVSAKF